jgi:DNA-binding XRE family transcriptional regulator
MLPGPGVRRKSASGFEVGHSGGRLQPIHFGHLDVHQDEVEARKRQLLTEMPLHELRRARQLSQEQLAEELGATRPGISKIEHRTDMYVSTLQHICSSR